MMTLVITKAMEMRRAYSAEGLFLHDKYGEKRAQCVRCYRWAHEDCGVEEDYFVCPMCRQSVKL